MSDMEEQNNNLSNDISLFQNGFASFEDLEKALSEYGKLRHVVFTIVSSQSIESYQKKLKRDVIPFVRAEIKHMFVTFGCKHFKQAKTESTGQRLTSSFKKDCKAFLKFKYDRKSDLLVMHKSNFEHNHIRSKEMYDLYPENRAIRNMTATQKSTLDSLRESKCSRQVLTQFSEQTTGLKETSKAVSNRKQACAKNSFLNSAQKLYALWQEDVERKGYVGHMKLNDKNEIVSFFWQTPEMRAAFAQAPEFVLCDFTYCLNICRMPLFVIQIVSGNNFSKVVGLAIVEKENQEHLKLIFETFKEYNPDYVNIQTFMVDKDMAEIAAIRESFPEAHIFLCLFHVLRAVRQWCDTHRMQDDARKEFNSFFAKIAYSRYEADYVANVKELRDATNKCKSVESKLFYEYFMNNWNNCKEMWVKYVRISKFNAGDNTTNRLESFNGKLKKFVMRYSDLDMFYQDTNKALEYLNEADELKMFNHIAKTKNYRIFKNPLLNAVHARFAETTTQYFAMMVRDQLIIFEENESQYEISEKYECSNAYLVGRKNKNTEHFTSELECECEENQRKLIPCNHIFALRNHLNLDLYAKELIITRYQMSNYIKSIPSPPKISVQHVNFEKNAANPKTAADNFQKSLKQLGHLMKDYPGCMEKADFFLGNLREIFCKLIKDPEKYKSDQARLAVIDEKNKPISLYPLTSYVTQNQIRNEKRKMSENVRKYGKKAKVEKMSEDPFLGPGEKEEDYKVPFSAYASHSIEAYSSKEISFNEISLSNKAAFCCQLSKNCNESTRPFDASNCKKTLVIPETILSSLNSLPEQSPVSEIYYEYDALAVKNSDLLKRHLTAYGEKIWLNKSYILSEVHHQTLHGKAMLQDGIINASMILMKREFPNVKGLITLQQFISNGFPNINLFLGKQGIFAQIPNLDANVTGAGHYISVCGYYDEKQINLTVYDSLNGGQSILQSKSLRNIISLIFKNHPVALQANPLIFLNTVQVTHQRGVDCGVHAIGNTYYFLHQIDPSSVRFNHDLIRRDLRYSLATEEMRFLSLDKENVNPSRRIELSFHMMHCSCRTFLKSVQLNRCHKCRELYHPKCQTLDEKDNKLYCFRCPDKIDVLDLDLDDDPCL